MLKLKVLLFSCALILAAIGSAVAEPKGPNGEKCDSSETGVKHTINGKEYTCDKCVYLKCDTSGGSISNCQRVTNWSNCEAALGGATIRPGGGLMAPPAVEGTEEPPNQPPRFPTRPPSGARSGQ